MIAKLFKEGEVSISERHPKLELAVKVQLFADGDLTVFISNPSGQFDDDTYEFLTRAYKKAHKKIKSFEAFRRDIQRVGSLLATSLTSIVAYQWGDASVEQITGMLGLGFIFPEMMVWGEKAFHWVKQKVF